MFFLAQKWTKEAPKSKYIIVINYSNGVISNSIRKSASLGGCRKNFNWDINIQIKMLTCEREFLFFDVTCKAFWKINFFSLWEIPKLHNFYMFFAHKLVWFKLCQIFFLILISKCLTFKDFLSSTKTDQKSPKKQMNFW